MHNKTKLECLETRQVLREGRLAMLKNLNTKCPSLENHRLVMMAEKLVAKGLKDIKQYNDGKISNN